MKINNSTNFDNTLNLPKETIPQDAKLVKKQGYFLESLQDPKKYLSAEEKNKNSKLIYNISQLPMEVYDKISPKDIVNEIFKDVLIRYECMQGNLAFHNIGFIYNPTLEDEKALAQNDTIKTRVEYQKKLYDEISNNIHSIRTLGTVMDYSKYNFSTISNEFSNECIDKFFYLYKNDKIYLKQKPMNYCSFCNKYYDNRQIKYVKKKHISLYVMYRVKEDFGAISKFNNLRNTYVVANTINPWIVAVSKNLAIEKDKKYLIVEVEHISSTNHYIIEKEKVKDVMMNAFFTKYEIKDEISSEELSKFILTNPLNYTDEINLFEVDEKYVSPDKKNSTGIRIVLPEYSYLDYLIYKNLDKKVDGDVIDNTGKILKGNVRVVGKNINEVNEFIVSFLRKGEYVFLEDYIPVKVQTCAKCGKDTIYINKPAFYIRKNKEELDNIKKFVLSTLDKSTFTKESFKNNVRRKIENLSNMQDVNISDYSMLGTPIPVYKCNGCGKIFLDEYTVEKTKEFITNKGITQVNIARAEDILKGKSMCSCGANMLEKCNIVLNDFFKKMCVNIFEEDKVLKRFPNKEKIDVLIESRNDFINNIKLLSYDMNGIEKLKNIEKFILHSDVSEDTKIIAKPIFFDKNNTEDLKNAITTEIGIRDVSKKYGTDILRLWGVLSARNRNIRLNEQSIIKADRTYRNLRRTLKYLLSNLQDFNPQTDYIPINERTDLDKTIYVKLYNMVQKVKDEYEKCNFDIACSTICKFTKKVLCQDYFPILKYKLYVLDKNDKIRIMTLSTFFDIFSELVMYLEPIIPFTLEEVWQYAWHSSKEEEKNILMHRDNLSLNKLEEDFDTKKWDRIFKFVKEANKKINAEIKKKTIKNSQDVCLVLNVLEEKKEFLEENIEELKRALCVSQIEINIVKDKEMRSVLIRMAEGNKCARCRNRTLDIGKDIRYVHLCLDCVKILEKE